MDSFAPFLESINENWGTKNAPGPKQLPKGEIERLLSSNWLPSTSTKEYGKVKIAGIKNEHAYDVWSPFF